MCQKRELMKQIKNGGNNGKDAYSQNLITSFFLSVKYWNKKNVLYFVTHFWNGLHDQILAPVDGLMKKHMRLIFEAAPTVLFLPMLVAHKYCQVFNFQKDKKLIVKWIAKGVHNKKDKELTIYNVKQFYNGMNKRIQNRKEIKNTFVVRKKLFNNVYKFTIQCYHCGKDCSASGKKLKFKIKICGSCCMVYYCGRKCQKIHWKYLHRYDCDKLRKLKHQYLKNKSICNVFNNE
eukprot:281943_1